MNPLLSVDTLEIFKQRSLYKPLGFIQIQTIALWYLIWFLQVAIPHLNELKTETERPRPLDFL